MNLFIGNLHADTNEGQLRELFKPFGKINSVNIIMDMDGRSKGFGFVEMDDVGDAGTAIKGLNGTEYMSSTIEVAEAIPPPANESEFMKKAREEKAAKQKSSASNKKR